MAGLTSTGFVPKTLGELRTEIGAGLRAVFGAAINLDSRSRFGQLRDLIASPLSTLWELGETLAGSFDPTGVNGVLLDNLCALTGTYRRPAFPSYAEQVVFTGDAATVLPVGRRVRVPTTSTIFETLDELTLVAATTWGAGAIAAGEFRSSDGGIWYCTAGGTSTTAPTGAGPWVNGAVTWTRVGEGLAFAQGNCEATANGALQGYAGTITVIDTPVGGWESAYNLTDAIPGALVESDSALRVRRTAEIAAMGSSPFPAILGRLLRVEGVTKVTLFENCTDNTVDSITPHAIEALIEGGTDAAIRAGIFAAKSGGIETCGGVSGSVVDAGGTSHTIKFSRVAEVDIWIKLALSINPGEYPSDGDAQVKAAIVAYGDAVAAGRDVVALAIAARVFDVPGVLDIPTLLIGTVNPPVSSTTIAISVRQKATYDTSRISITTTPGVP